MEGEDKLEEELRPSRSFAYANRRLMEIGDETRGHSGLLLVAGAEAETAPVLAVVSVCLCVCSVSGSNMERFLVGGGCRWGVFSLIEADFFRALL